MLHDLVVIGSHLLLRLDPRPTAIFASNDEMAAGVYHAARQLGLSIPDDLSVVGFDDTMVAQIAAPALTTVHQPLEESGRRAVERLVAALDDEDSQPHEERLDLRLEVRRTTAPPQ